MTHFKKNQMKILVTGSNGLVGTALKKILGDGHIYHTKKDVDLTDESKTKDYIKYHKTIFFLNFFLVKRKIILNGNEIIVNLL